MEYVPFSSFRRPISRAQLQAIPDTQDPLRPVNKWALFRELSKAQAAFGLSERELTVLQGLLSFHPEDELGAAARMIVFPSNRALCERLNGMACSTMRRHLSRLIASGLIIRRDSPNGKRYSRRDGDDRVAYGFDLSPLPRRQEEIFRAADDARASETRLRRLREMVSLMRRDLAAVAEYGHDMQPGRAIWDRFADLAALTGRALRRKLDTDALDALRGELDTALTEARDLVDTAHAADPSTTACQDEQHHHNSNKDSLDLEPCNETRRISDDAHVFQMTGRDDPPERDKAPRLPLQMITACCPTALDFHEGPIRHWHQLFNTASRISPAMGITPSAWEDAQRAMGPEQAAIVVVAMLERFSEIKSPGGYLRALSRKAANGGFSCGPMVMALRNRAA
ncbi:plasmid replication protein RepC [Chachezhania antarctica]|uniref:plasmid replication protein RepC n=1 Tax=Chachezhania antarctica TaxID=2340860 RepID=UPI000EACAB70|nr:plasmid replication protein RepC [Chachezhania antarctica]|tara:strand:- start:3269 stop:4459 length:1191 start_codon:yes stop_codon:yes gene_type:complete